MFESPVPVVESGEVAEGTDDRNPIRLEGIKVQDFEQLLKVMFRSYVPASENGILPRPVTVLAAHSKMTYPSTVTNGSQCSNCPPCGTL
jgi:hypothetical protein